MCMFIMQTFTSKLAASHHKHHLMRKAWNAWHLLIENNWRCRVEKACQNKAQEVCMGLTDQYESQIAAVGILFKCIKFFCFFCS